MTQDRLSSLFLKTFGFPPLRVDALPASGSRRRYFRLVSEGRSAIGVIGTDLRENAAFVGLSRHFASKGLNVPAVYAVDDDGYCYLQEDLGDLSLFDAVSSGRKAGKYSADEEALLTEAMAALPKLQFEGAKGLDGKLLYPAPRFDGSLVDFDLNYFKYCFLKPSGTEFDEYALQKDFDLLRSDLTEGASCDTFLYRDFQSRNVMVRDSRPWFIDFQGGRFGPVYYDVASFVWQARARYPDDLKDRLIDAYLQALGEYRSLSREEFMSNLRLFVLFRQLQVLAAYGFRGNFERKRHFIESIPPAIESLKKLISNPFPRYPYLMSVLGDMVGEYGKNETQPSDLSGDGLLVEVFSFSYKKEIPSDPSGNGGGYVFDCRGLPNPGREMAFRCFDGGDAPVKEWLDSKNEVAEFLDAAFALVSPHVRCFVERGFSHLQVAFGCTGGQHRSVYCADALAQRIKLACPEVTVKVRHIERGRETIL